MSRLLEPGDPAPAFTAATGHRPDFRFDTVAGRYVVLSFFGSAADARAASLLAAVAAETGPFDDVHATFFGVTQDPADAVRGRLPTRLPGLRHFHDPDRAISAAYGAAEERVSYVLSPNLRVLGRFPLGDGERHAEVLTGLVRALPPVTPLDPRPPGAPVLVVPDLFEPDLCQALIEHHERAGGTESGFAVSLPDGGTVSVLDPAHKRRTDVTVDDPRLRQAVKERIERRLVPEIRKVFQFEATRIERYLIGRYAAGQGGHFRAHRDNTTAGTAHRRFALTVNLDTGRFSGGDLRFPEYDRHCHRPPTGAGLVFSCGLLHEVLPVTDGVRYCCLTFLYDEAAARLRVR